MGSISTSTVPFGGVLHACLLLHHPTCRLEQLPLATLVKNKAKILYPPFQFVKHRLQFFLLKRCDSL